jgi:EmrB/QacA subfamily drug resistance transporter
MHKIDMSKRDIILIMISLMISLLLAALDSTIVGTAMPKIIGDLQGMEHYSWPFTAYMLCSTIAILIFGKLSDMYGRKPVIIFGIILFLISSALCGISGSMKQLIIFRGMQGVGGGVIISNVFIIVGELFSPAKRGKYMGIIASMWGLSSVIGPAIGGIITDTLSWRWVFYVNIPLGVFALFLVTIVLPDFRYHDAKKVIDLKGIAVFTLSVVSLFLALTSLGNKSWNSPQVIGLLAFFIAMISLLVMIERKAAEPIFPPSLFSKSIFNISSIIMFLSSAVMFCGVIYVPLFVQTVLGMSATGSGGTTTPMMLGVALSAMLSGQMISFTGKYKIFGIISIALMLSGTILLSTMNGGTSGFRVLLFSAIFGLGSGGIIPVANVAVQNAFSHRQLGIVTSSMQFFRNIGATAGTVIFGQVLKINMTTGFSLLDMTEVPQNAVAVLKNPRTLTNETAMNSIRSLLPAKLIPVFNELIFKARGVLVHSIHRVFIFAVVIISLAFIISFALKEMPLRRHQEIAPTDI